MIDKLEHKLQSSEEAFKRNLSQKVQTAKETNSRMDEVARRAKEVEQRKMEKKYHQFSEQIKKYHEKLVIRKELLDWQQYQTKMANERRFTHHLETSKNIKQLDRDKLLQSIQEKQSQAEERVAKQEQDME